MLIIKAGNIGEAHWDEESERWRSSNADSEFILNLSLPTFDFCSGLMEGGRQGLALKAAQAEHPWITVVKLIPPEEHEEKPGVDV